MQDQAVEEATYPGQGLSINPWFHSKMGHVRFQFYQELKHDDNPLNNVMEEVHYLSHEIDQKQQRSNDSPSQ